MTDQAAHTKNSVEETLGSWENFLLKLRYQKSRLLKSSTYRPILLNRPETAWLVYVGSVDVFSVTLVDGQPSGTRQFLFQATTGSLLMGTDLARQQRGMVVMQSPHAQLLEFNRDKLLELADDPAFTDLVVQLIDDWIIQATKLVAPKLAPKEYTSLDNIDHLEIPVETDQVVRMNAQVRWIAHQSGQSHWMGRESFFLTPEFPPFPLTRHAWLALEAGSSINAFGTSTLLQEGRLWSALDAFDQALIQDLITYSTTQAEQDQTALLARAESDIVRFNAALTDIANTLELVRNPIHQAVSTNNVLLAACQLVGEAQGIAVQTPPLSAGAMTLYTITEATRIQTREVKLTGDWWRRDNGPLLGYMADDGRPVALLLQSTSSYIVHDPAQRQSYRLTGKQAATLSPFAVQFYRSLPLEPMTPWELLRFALVGGRRDLSLIILAGVLLGGLNLSIPFAVSILFNQTIPRGHLSELVPIAILLFISVWATFIFQLTQRIAVVRLESRADMTVTEALWDRLLGQKPSFFQQYAAGDLGTRGMGFSQIRTLLSDLVSNSLSLIAFLVFNFLAMLVLSPPLAMLSLGLLLIVFAVTFGVGARSLRYVRDLNEIMGENMGYILQFINGIRKFRVAAAERRVFAAWAERFTHQRRITYKMRILQNQIIMFSVAFPFFATMLLFLVASDYRDSLSVGAFAAFFITFTQFLAASTELGAMVIISLSVIPLYERAHPILHTKPEIPEGMVHPGELYGDIDVRHVSFRYYEGQQAVLDDISLHIERGEFVAIVGESGCGKSTLLRLLLGFERPETGAVYYDQKDLKDLNAHAVRQQIGVVMQNAQLMAGNDLFRNIIGISQNLTLDDAWYAAEMVGLADDIRAMPMGMQTLVTEGGGTLSGGQKQRLLIAAAVVNKPRIIFFDEATSALDNRTQQIVGVSLEKIDATRIAIAHRLSTIIHADKIIVMDNGKVVQVGSYASLMKEDGPFAKMAQRQMA